MLYITRRISVPIEEIELKPIRAQGPGGQHVNKTSSAIQCRFDVHASSLPAAVKEALLCLSDQRMTRDGVIVIKAQQYRSQEQNRDAALARLQALIRSVATRPKPRVATRPTLASRHRRREGKIHRASTKALRKPPTD